MKAAVILSGSGVFDGSEIHESVFTLLALEENGVDYQCFAPNKSQYHVVNHLSGEPMEETRNVMVESARIARGKVKDLIDLSANEFDFLVIPGGFGAAKNLNQWAIAGPEGELDEVVQKTVLDFVQTGKPICGLCMGPTVIAQSLADEKYAPILTVGTTEEQSPYDIAAISNGMETFGSRVEFKTIKEVAVDKELKIVSAPCYMMEASMVQVRANITQAIEATMELVV